MRRDDYLCKSDELVLSALLEEPFGYLGINDSLGIPRPVPLHFVECDGSIYFHGASSGEKYEAFVQKQPLSFSLIKALAMIPSYWRSKNYACPATSYYMSAYGRGTGLLISDYFEKAKYLQLLMKKYQPDGGFTAIHPDLKMYKEPLIETALFEVKISKWNIKCKVGQNLNQKGIQSIMGKLRERGTKIDLETLRWIALISQSTTSENILKNLKNSPDMK